MKDYTLVFEGVDRCGKSSLIEMFRKKNHDHMLEKMRVPRTLSEAVMWYEDYFNDLRCRRTNGPKIWDRGHISELVYAPLYRSYVHSSWPSTLYSMEDHYLKNRAVIIVYVYPIWYNLLKDDDRAGADRNKELIAYDVALGQTSLPVINITKHESRTVAWRDPGLVHNELMDKIDEQLDLISARS